MCSKVNQSYQQLIGLSVVLLISLLGFYWRPVTESVATNLGRVSLIRQCLLGCQLSSILHEYQNQELTYESNMLLIEHGDYLDIVQNLPNIRLGAGKFELLTWQLGLALFDNGDVDDVVQVWRFKLNTVSIEDSLLRQGNKAEISGDLLVAERSYRAYVFLNPIPERFEFLGEFYLRTGRSSEAIEIFRQSQDIANEPMRAYLSGRIAEEEGNYLSAEEAFRRAIASGYEGIAVRVHLAKILAFRLGDWDQAISVCREAITIFPGDYQCYEILSLIYANNGDIQAAIDWLEIGVSSIESRYATTLQSSFQQRIGFLYLEQDQIEQAETHFKLAIALNPNNAEAYYGLAGVFIENNNYESGADILESAIKNRIRTGKNVPYSWYDQLGNAYEQLGDIQSALVAYREALLINPQDPVATERIVILEQETK